MSTHQIKQTRVVYSTFKHEPVRGDLHVFKLLTTWEKRSSLTKGPAEGEKNAQGFTTSDGIAKFLEGSDENITTHPQAVAGSPGLVEGIRRYGIGSNWFEGQYPFVGTGSRNARAFDEWVDGQLTADEIVLLDLSNNLAADSHGVPLPVANFLGYSPSEGQVHNGLYDLNKVATILGKRSDIRFVNPRERDSEVPKGWDPIQSVPYYNADEGRSYYIPCVWMPTREDYLKLSEHLGDRLGLSMDRAAAIFDLDLLGLRAGGAARSESYYGE